MDTITLPNADAIIADRPVPDALVAAVSAPADAIVADRPVPAKLAAAVTLLSK